MNLKKREILFDSARIKSAVEKVAIEISCYVSSNGIRRLDVLWVAEGAVMFAADLLRALPPDLQTRVSSIRVSSYGDALSPVGEPVLQGDIRRFKDRDVLVVDDVLDTGGTMRALLEALKSAGARSVKSCVLISKRFSGKRAVEADFKCFEAGSEFVYGYGLDFKGMYRNLADICIYRESETEEDSNDKTANY